MSVSGVQPASFRDPSGFVFRDGGTLYRQVNRSYQDHYDSLMGSGLYAALTGRGWLVRHEEVKEGNLDDRAAYKILQPEQIRFVSYPYEWSFSQLKDAALLTLDVQIEAFKYGLMLKDASAYNVQFHHGRPILIDTLSFERYLEGQPWSAYRQFCQHFLAPLALMAKRDVRLNQLMRIYIDGVPLDLASGILPARTWLNPGLAMHLHLHAKTQRAFSRSEKKSPGKMERLARVSKRGLGGFLQGLRGTVSKLAWSPTGTEWVNYYGATNYSDPAFQEKQRLVRKYLEAVQPAEVWDLGANTGLFSRIASSMGVPTLAFDVDPAAVEVNYRHVRDKNEKWPLPLLVDLANPSPGLGWSNTERDSLLDRGPAACVMALALVHHLAISNNVPLDRTAAFFDQICRFLIIEFVPKSDSQVRRLLSSRADIFDRYSRDDFEKAFAGRFEVLRADGIGGSERTLYLMQKRGR